MQTKAKTYTVTLTEAELQLIDDAVTLCNDMSEMAVENPAEFTTLGEKLNSLFELIVASENGSYWVLENLLSGGAGYHERHAGALYDCVEAYKDITFSEWEHEEGDEELAVLDRGMWRIRRIDP